jgi:hypothetical protein
MDTKLETSVNELYCMQTSEPVLHVMELYCTQRSSSSCGNSDVPKQASGEADEREI